MSRNNPRKWQRLAQRHGVQPSYIDNLGKKQTISEETLRLILAQLGASEEERGWPVIEPVAVCWHNARSHVTVRLPAREIARATLRLRMEDGGEECIPLRKLTGLRESKVEAEKIAELRLDVPELPIGYHSLVVERRDQMHEALLISAPKKLYVEPRRQWGAFMPLYAAHSRASWGAGNLGDWRSLCRWIGGLGGSVMGTLPLMAASLDGPACEPSPYSPASRLFWNEFFIDIAAVPEFKHSKAALKLAGSTELTQQIAQFRRAELIDYKAQWALRRRVLEVMARDFFSKSSARYGEFRKFLKARPEVEEYARFRAACDRAQKSWHTWGAEAKAGRLEDYSDDTKSFYLYVQWITQQQMDGVLQTCRDSGVKFYLDLPLGVNPDGFDAWRYRDFFAKGVSTGAPPDSFFTKGQDWGFAPLHPQRTRELQYRYVIDYLRFQMRHTGLLRIDHVMGLHRLWWVPHGFPASAGAYVRYLAEEWYAILSVESHRHKTTLVGENLGTVPPEVNKSMDRHGLRRMYVLQYEQPVKGPLRTPEAPVVASVNTHDMPSFAAHWRGLDLADRADLGLLPKKSAAAEKRQRERLKKNFMAFLRKQKLLRNKKADAKKVLEGALRFLAASPAETVLVTLEDLWSEERSQNVPGTSTERPNWRRKARRTIEDICSDQQLAAWLRGAMERTDPSKPETR